MRVLSAVLLGLGVALGSFSALAQVRCADAPACPDDGATPIGDVSPDCFCPRPASCPEPDEYRCQLELNSSADPTAWFCSCTPEPVPPRRGRGDEGLCGGLSCPDGSAPTLEDGQCRCPIDPDAEVICEGHCSDGTPVGVLGDQCGCLDQTEHCSGTLCQDGKGQFTTTDGACICSDGQPAPPIFVPE
jgi:hypothetical protein